MQIPEFDQHGFLIFHTSCGENNSLMIMTRTILFFAFLCIKCWHLLETISSQFIELCGFFPAANSYTFALRNLS